MSKHLNNTLPFEILKKIFQNLIANSPEKKDLKTCSSVCKSWEVAAQEVFGKISIEVNEDSLEKLSRDIVYFAQKVKSIGLKQCRPAEVDRTVTCVVWLGIILACPNLVSIKINIKDDSNYVRCLMDIATERLDHIQSFETTTSHLHLQLNLKYCKSVTSLSIASLWNFSGNDRSDILVYFISLFLKLTSFGLKHPYTDNAVDIIQFFEVAPQLQDLFIRYFDEVKSSSLKILDNSCLSVLRLAVEEMDINSLIFITTRLKKLNKLELRIDILVTGVPQKIYGIREDYGAKELLDDLKDCTSGISEFFIKYKHENITYTLVNGEEPQISSNEENYDDDGDDDNNIGYYEYDNDSYSDKWLDDDSVYHTDNDWYDWYDWYDCDDDYKR